MHRPVVWEVEIGPFAFLGSVGANRGARAISRRVVRVQSYTTHAIQESEFMLVKKQKLIAKERLEKKIRGLAARSGRIVSRGSEIQALSWECGDGAINSK